MGRFNKKGKKRLRDNKPKEDVPESKRSAPPRPQAHSSSAMLSNEGFERAYRGSIVPDAEWDAFIAAMRTPLATTFRFQLEDAETRSAHFEKTWVPALKGLRVGGAVRGKDSAGASADGGAAPAAAGATKKGAGADAPTAAGWDASDAVDVPPPRRVPWVPRGVAWRFDINRKFLRRDPVLKELQRYLVRSADSGDLTRQEEVSMIPVVLLDPRPGQRVIDLCAAPGSKTSQILDAVGREGEGLVIANDADAKRCHVLTHQTLRRMATPKLIVTNNDARHYPNIEDTTRPGKRLLFDRVLADVPCSGSGTFRKNINLWRTWNPSSEIGLHAMQLAIAHRAATMLKPGGRMVYSTCSLSPVENEAVVAALLRERPELSLLEPDNLPGLKARPGIDDWELVTKDFERYKNFDSLPEAKRNSYPRTMFPPAEEEVPALNLHRCIRILPQDMDSGGFFVAVIGKSEDAAEPKNLRPRPEEAPAAADADANANADANSNDAASANDAGNGTDGTDKGGKGKGAVSNEDLPPAANFDPRYRPAGDHPVVKAAYEYYGIDPASFPQDRLLSRGDAARRVTYVTKDVLNVLAADEGREKLEVVAAGVYIIKAPPLAGDAEEDATGAVERKASGTGRIYRLQSEGLMFIAPKINRHIVDGDDAKYRNLIEKGVIRKSDMDAEWAKAYDDLGHNGPFVARFKVNALPLGDEKTLYVPMWRGASGFAHQIAKTEFERLQVDYGFADDGTAAAKKAKDVDREVRGITDEGGKVNEEGGKD